MSVEDLQGLIASDQNACVSKVVSGSLRNVNPSRYNGHIRQSVRQVQIIRGDKPSRLCILDFVGSSRSTLGHDRDQPKIGRGIEMTYLLTMIFSSLRGSFSTQRL